MTPAISWGLFVSPGGLNVMPDIRRVIQNIRSAVVAFVAFAARIPTNRYLARSVLYYWVGVCPLAVFGNLVLYMKFSGRGGPVISLLGSPSLLLIFPTAGETYFHEFGWTEDRVHGVDALLYGWFLVLCGCPAWLANPLMLVAAALMYFKMWSPAITIASIALACSLTICFVYTPFPTHTKTENILCSGGLIWLSAIACMWTSAVVARRNNLRLAAALIIPPKTQWHSSYIDYSKPT